MEEEIISKVWLLHGTFGGGTPGMLALDHGNISFISEEGEHFNVPVADVKEVKWPFISFGFAMNAVINGQKYKFSFIKPNGASDLNDSALHQLVSLTRAGRGVDAVATLTNIGKEKKAAKQWKAILSS
jgi:hypothetical protein